MEQLENLTLVLDRIAVELEEQNKRLCQISKTIELISTSLGTLDSTLYEVVTLMD